MALDFPTNPVNGQIYDNYYYDSVMGTWRAQGSGLALNAFINPTITGGTISNLTTDLAVTDGGTGASDAAGARTSLGITPANIGAATTSHVHSAADITTGNLAIARGGTGVATGTGLTPMIPTSVSVSSGSGSVAANGTVTFSGANTVRINGCFTTDFLNYKIIFNQRSASATLADGFIRLRSDTTDLSSASYYYNGTVTDNNTVQGNSSLGTNQWFVYTTHPATDPTAHSSFVMNIFQPFLSTVPTTFNNHASIWYGNARQIVNGGFNTTLASYNGFTMYLGGGQTFGGVFRIYGYN